MEGGRFMSEVIVIGIAGGTGSGKSTISKKLMQRFGEDVSVIHHDSYYKAHHEMPYEERCKLNYDHPNRPSDPGCKRPERRKGSRMPGL